MVGTGEGLVVPVLQSVALGEAELLLLRDCVTLTVALLLTLNVKAAVVARGLGLPVVDVLGVRVPVIDTVAVAHKVAEAQPDTEEEALVEMVAESVRLVVAVGVNACVVGNGVGLMLPVPLNVMLGEAELLLL